MCMSSAPDYTGATRLRDPAGEGAEASCESGKRCRTSGDRLRQIGERRQRCVQSADTWVVSVKIAPKPS